MRLNQLAKKVGKPYTRVEKYIRKDLNIEGVEGPNARVDESIVENVINKFGLAKEDSSKSEAKSKVTVVEAKAADISPDETGQEDVDLNKLEATPAEIVQPNLEGLEELSTGEPTDESTSASDNTNEKVESDSNADTEVKVENTDSKENIAIIETEETVLHLDDEGTIVAPKVKLEGIKVKGKIDLPGVNDEDDVKGEAVTEEASSTETIEELSEEELEQKREAERIAAEKAEQVRIERQRRLDEEAARAAEYKAKQEKKRQEELRKKIEAEKRRKREEGKKHYINKVQAKPPVKKKKKKKSAVKTEVEFEVKEKYQNTENLTTWQKIVRWFNT